MRLAAARTLDGRLSTLNLSPEPARAIEREAVRMTVGVVFHTVASRANRGHDVGVSFSAPTHAEERRSCTSLVEQIQNRRRQLGMRTVVEGEGDHAFRGLCLGQPGDIGAKPRASRKHTGDAEHGMVADHRSQRHTP